MKFSPRFCSRINLFYIQFVSNRSRSVFGFFFKSFYRPAPIDYRVWNIPSITTWSFFNQANKIDIHSFSFRYYTCTVAQHFKNIIIYNIIWFCLVSFPIYIAITSRKWQCNKYPFSNLYAFELSFAPPYSVSK